MKLFFDTETTGKCAFRSPAEAVHQPRVVQLAALLCDDQGEEVAHMNVIVRPNGFRIPEEASRIHGITTEHALMCGVKETVAFMMFDELMTPASRVIAHNIQFDRLMMSRGSEVRAEMLVKIGFCTMQTMTEECRLPGRYGFKWPTLQEAYFHCFGRYFEGAHDALADVRACKEIYFWLRKNNKTGLDKEEGRPKPAPASLLNDGSCVTEGGTDGKSALQEGSRA